MTSVPSTRMVGDPQLQRSLGVSGAVTSTSETGGESRAGPALAAAPRDGEPYTQIYGQRRRGPTGAGNHTRGGYCIGRVSPSRLATVSTTSPQRSAFSSLLRHFRTQRGLSQLALALRVETTTRHLSYLENGRSRPGRELVLRLADSLELPLRSRNELLVAAGLAAEFPARALGDAVLAPYRRAITGFIAALEPFPAFVLDPLLHLEETNVAGRRFVPGPPGGARLNLLDAFLAPGPARDQLDNFAEVAWSLFTRFSRAAASLPADTPEVDPLRRRIQQYLDGVPRPTPDAVGEPVICPTFRVGGRKIRTIGMTMRFGPSRDVTLEELSVDVLYPRDDDAEQFFRALTRGG